MEDPRFAGNKVTFKWWLSKKPKDNHHTATNYVSSWASGKMLITVEQRPKILEEAGVPQDKWELIHALIAGELTPASMKCIGDYEQYIINVSRPYQHDCEQTNREVALNGVEACASHSDVSVAAVATKDRVNAVLAKYGAVAVLVYETIGARTKMRAAISNVAGGLEFYRL